MMLLEPSTLAAAARLIAETLEKNYGVDYQPVFKRLELDVDKMEVAGARYPSKKMQALWVESVAATGDECFGLAVGANIRPTTFHALGFSWLASRTLLESLQRLCRYSSMISNVPYTLRMQERDDTWQLIQESTEWGSPAAARISQDAFFVAIVRMCQQARDKHVHPIAVHLQRPPTDRLNDYVQAFQAPVYFDAGFSGLVFDKVMLESPLPGDNLELAIANDRISEEYINALEPGRVASQVRKLLIELLPSGDTNQEMIARQLNRSLSTLQRQLGAEGTSYSTIRDATRRELAEQYVREGRYSLSQIAYLLGFSDQSNFSRAFRRWTGQSPGSYSR